MKLLRLCVEHFGCVREAEVEFGPMLNVLYGPNDLGKSSLVAAVRSALLLPHGSSAYEPHVTWNSASRPVVELTLLTEPHRYYRIRKAFGSNGTSILEFSTDGRSYRTEAKGRKVDGVIRKSLRWGIAEPGGRGGPRGMPVSFLATTLLGQQDAVTDIFGSKLGDDPDGSGRKRLIDALQATARDPFFTAILNDVQAEVDRAFTPTGRKSTARTSPFKRVADAIKEAESQLDALTQDVEAGDRIRDRLSQLEQERLASKDDHGDAVDRQAGLERIVARQRERAAARAELEKSEQLLTDAEDAETALAATMKRCDELKKQRDQCAEAVQAAAKERDAADESLRELEREQGEARQRVQACELDLARVANELQSARDRASKAEAVRQAGEKCEELARDIAELDAALATRKADQERDRVTLDGLEAERQVLAGVELWLRWRALDQRSQQTAVEMAKLVAEAEQAEETARQLATRLRTHGLLPGPETMDHLGELHEDLLRAEAALEVGLSVMIESPAGLQIAASRDGGELDDLGEVRDSTRLSATREIRLALADLGSIRILGGTPEAQERHRQARESWEKHSAPVFEKAGVGSLSALKDLVARAEDDEYELRELAEKDRHTEEQFESRRQPLTGGESLWERRATLREKLADHDLDVVTRRGETLLAGEGLPRDPTERLRRERDAVERESDAVRTRLSDSELRQAGDQSRRDSLREQLDEASAKRDAATAELAAPWQDALSEAGEAITTLETQLTELEERRASLSLEADGEREATARARVTTAEERLVQAGGEHKRISDELATAQVEHNRLDRELEIKSEAARHAAPERARERVAALSIELTELRGALGLDDGGPDVTGEQVEQAQALASRLYSELRDLDRKIHEAQGELRRTGGDRVRERTEDMRRYREDLHKKHRTTELDYDAWKLLRDTMRDVDKDQATHLGRLMIAPITEQFQELTRSRYGAMELGPDLETRGIQAAGERRDIDLLSMGTKEQLSALFRLSVAEKLGSAVLLDDQLTQTDPERMSWFRTRLREISRAIQVIVLTCRAGDYLEEHEFSHGIADDVSAIPLEQRIVRV